MVKKYLQLLIGIIISIIIFIGIIFIFTNNTKPKKNIYNTLASNVSNVNLDDLSFVKEYLSQYNEIEIAKSISKKTFNEDGTTEIKYAENIITTINVKEKNEFTMTKEDYANCSDYTTVNKLNFNDYFSFDYTQYDNLYDLILAFAKDQNINTNLENAHLDDRINIQNQEIYILNEDSKVLKQIIDNIEYDEIIDSYARYSLTGDGFKEKGIGYFNAIVKYRKDNKIIYYNVILEFNIPDSDLSCGCGCGSEDLSECDDNDCTVYQTQGSSDANYK